MLNEVLKELVPSVLDTEVKNAMDLAAEAERKRIESKRWRLYKSQVDAKWFPFLMQRQVEFEQWLVDYEARYKQTKPSMDWSKC